MGMLSALPSGFLGRILTRIGIRPTTESPDEPGPDSPPDEPTKRKHPPPLESQIMRVLIQHDGRISREEMITELGVGGAKLDEILELLSEDDEVRIIERGRSTIIARPGYEPVGYRVT